MRRASTDFIIMMFWCSVNRALRMAISSQNKTSMPDKSEWAVLQGYLQHHNDVGNAGEKYFQSLRYFTSDSGIFRILAEEERKLVQIKH